MSDTEQNTATAPAAPSSPTEGKARYTVVVDTVVSRIALAGFVIAILALIAAPGFVPRATLQDLLLIVLLIGLAQCWNLLAGFAGLISVGQQAFVGLGAYGLFYFVTMTGADPLASVALSAVFVGLLSIPVGLVVFRLQGAYFAVVTWVVAEVFRLLVQQWPTLGGGAGTSLPRSATTEMIGIDFAMSLFDVRSAAGREIIIYWVVLAAVVAIVAIAYGML